MIEKIYSLVEHFQKYPSFLDHIFKNEKYPVLSGKPIVIFGAGELGIEIFFALQRFDLNVVAFCDNDSLKQGSNIKNIPVISTKELSNAFKDCCIVIGASKNAVDIENQLLSMGFERNQIFCKLSDYPEGFIKFLHLYAMNSFGSCYYGMPLRAHPLNLIDILVRDQEKIAQAYSLFSDELSRKIFINKLALLVSGECFEFYCHFIKNFSAPFEEFISKNQFKSEEYYYFHNGVFDVEEGEIYVDVGAADGDTVDTFNMVCKERGLNSTKIIAFEPDPNNFKSLKKQTAHLNNISCFDLGLWSHNDVLQFKSSNVSSTSESASIDSDGDITIKVVSLDNFLEGQKVTFIKMDPPDGIVIKAIMGSQMTIKKHAPKLCLAAYHTLEAVYEIPILLQELRPDYKIYLRHHALHLNETEILAHI
jgi:FkbM family methyltransferase